LKSNLIDRFGSIDALNHFESIEMLNYWQCRLVISLDSINRPKYILYIENIHILISLGLFLTVSLVSPRCRRFDRSVCLFPCSDQRTTRFSINYIELLSFCGIKSKKLTNFFGAFVKEHAFDVRFRAHLSVPAV
jgi:hypothetical protein